MIEITTENQEGILFIIVDGEIDAGSSIYLDNVLKEAMESNEKKIVINMSGLDYISSAGLGVFIAYLDEFKLQGIRLVLFGIKESVKQVFTILGLEKLLIIVKTEKEAINSLNE